MNTFDIRDCQAITNLLNDYFSIFSHCKFMLYKGEKYKSVSDVKIIDYNGSNIVYQYNVNFLSKKRGQYKREYIMNLYLDKESYTLLLQDQANIADIKKLNIYDLKKYKFEMNSGKIGYNFLILESISNQNVLENVRKELNLRNPDAIKQKINHYFKKSKGFRKYGQKLALEDEKFIEVTKAEELAFGLNNVVYNIAVNLKAV